MTDQDLQNLYRQNLGVSESAALRGVFDAGYQFGISQSVTASTPDESIVVSASAVASDVPVVTTQ